jgi:hypothetical protein
MKIIDILLIITIASLLITAGCITGEKTPGITPPIHTKTLTVQSPAISPETTKLKENYADQIIGAWKTQDNNNQVIFWQFDKEGNLTGGYEPKSHELTGNWSNMGFPNLFELNAVNTNSTGFQKNYSFVFYYDINNKKVMGTGPGDYNNVTFIRQS